MSHLDIERCLLYYEDTGSASGDSRETVVFFNGWSISSRYWKPLIELLFPRYRCVSFDQSGTGRTKVKRPLPPFTVEGFADEAEKLLEELGLLAGRRLHIVAHSMGGMVATEVCNRFPDALLSVTIVNCGIFDDELLKSFHHVLLGAMIGLSMNLKGLFRFEPFKSLFIDRAIGKPIESRFRDIFVEDFITSDNDASASVGRFTIAPLTVGRYTREAVGIRAPLLCVVGMADRTIPPEGMITLYERRKERSGWPTVLEIFEDAGHLPMLEDLPRFSAVLQRHFDSVREYRRSGS
ncbi:alpha/beta hydrolase [Chlorobaculum limnaeum]|uniref:Alpha/beta hydrolase n=1 Tax=Chlorobaculum limnaeum TaxID=274537 RepID=A0A1D8D2B1_CHLLM|nr:alpha/beta hydrolase [Chlorobaculum limnaeum]AOS84611.1 alpha/beta hydrolase [Chlorobaculum limnaeum]